jgi:hypothetical protein
MGILKILPPLAAIAALGVWGLTLLRLVAPSTLSEIITTGFAALLIVLAQSQRMNFSILLFWLSGGIWSGVAYHNMEVIGFAYFVVAVLALGSAAYFEHERGKFSLSGPAAFIAAMIIALVAATTLSG